MEGLIVAVVAGVIPLSFPGSENQPLTVATGSPLSAGRAGFRSVAAFAASNVFRSASDWRVLEVSVTAASEPPVVAGSAVVIGFASASTGCAAGSSGCTAFAVAPRVPESILRASTWSTRAPAPGAGAGPRIAS